MASDMYESESELSSDDSNEDNNYESEENSLPDPHEYNIRFFDDDEEGDAVAAAVVNEKKESIEEIRSDIEDEEDLEADDLAVSF